MSLSIINRDRLLAAVILNMILMVTLFIVTVITISLYSDNQQIKKQLLTEQTPISIVVGIGKQPQPVLTVKADPTEVLAPKLVTTTKTIVVPEVAKMPPPAPKEQTVVVID